MAALAGPPSILTSLPPDRTGPSRRRSELEISEHSGVGISTEDRHRSASPRAGENERACGEAAVDTVSRIEK